MSGRWQTHLKADPTAWLLASDEPWTGYRTLVDLLDRPEDDGERQAARGAMLAHPQVQALMMETATWGERSLKRHNDASHTIYAFSVLADLGVRAEDARSRGGGRPEGRAALATGLEALLAHQSPEGAFQTAINIPLRFGGSGQDAWTWMLCDAPTLLYSLLAFDLREDPRVQRAVEHLVSTLDENGWRCLASAELGRFKGPGRREDPCPIANVYALKALSLLPELADSPATRRGAEMLLWHWECRGERKPFLFGIGSDYRRLKYPFVWYDILHVVDVLSRFPFVRGDARFREMVDTILAAGDEQGRFTASSMYRAWRGWSFADKKHPSPWLTFLCCRVLRRVFA